nr:MAG TPA: hypothetical protein [Caudoviricetes sp.]
MKVLSKNNKVIIADGHAIEWQSGNDIPLKVLTRNNKLLLADGKALRNLKLPTTYTELPYLVATDDSKAWIDLGIPYQNGCRVEYKTTYKAGANIFGVFYTTERCRGYITNNTAYFNVGTSSSTTVYPSIDGLTIGTVYTITCQANPNATITVNGQTITYDLDTQYLTWDSSPHNIYLFAINRTNTDTTAQGIRVIHYFKYWDVNGNLLLDLIPVERKSDGILGMYNQADGRFLTNISTGTFYKEVPASADEEIDDMEIV